MSHFHWLSRTPAALAHITNTTLIMTTATATATTSMPDMTNKDHEDFLDFLSDTNTESGDSSSCPSSPDEDGSLVLSSTGDENDDNTLESLLAMDDSGIDIDLQLIDSPRKPSAPPEAARTG